jgi:hypothetical protein
MRVTRKQTSWIIAIPSYKRAETLRDKTLTVLKQYRISANKIHIFVATKEEEETYKSILVPGSYGHMHVAVPGMAAVRNFITEFFPVGKHVFNLDDDIRGFLQWSPTARRNEIPLRSLSDAITKGFAMAQKTGYRLFGFYPVANGYFKKNKVTEDLRYIIGSAWGIINPGRILTVTIDDKEDYLRSVIMYVLDGGVLRFSTIAPESQYYTEAGGMQETRTMKRIETSAKAMVAAFPDLVTINLTKKSGKPEVRLRDSRPEPTFGTTTLAAYKMPTVKI